MIDSPAVPPAASLPVLALVRDLMFVGRVRAEADRAGVALAHLRDPAKLAAASGRLLIVDLNLDGALEAAGAWRAATAGRVVGFVAHIDADTIRRARAAGLDRVMPRSQFVVALPELLAEWADTTDRN